MRKFTYLVPKTLDEAISMHVSYDGRARYIAGGTDVLVKLKEGKIGPVTRKIRQLYQDVIRGRFPKYKHWLTPVY